jgi:HAE1 family hydrophobic/amphiphilic exporter-1
VSLAKRVVSRPVLVTIVFILVAIIGLYSIFQLPLDLFPSNEEPTMMVSTTWTGNNPATVEKLVTKVLEGSLASVEGLSDISSTSSEGSSLITLTFEYGTNLDAATNDIRDKIDRIKSRLPDAAGTPTIMKFSGSSMPVMRLAVKGNRTAEELRELAENTIEPRISQASGVAQVSVSGGRTKIVRADISRNRLEAYGLTITAISTALAKQNVQIGGGSIDEGGSSYSIRTTGEFETMEQIADAVVAAKNGYGVRLRDVAEVYAGYEDESSAVFINGETGVYLSVQKRTGANSVQTADSVYAKIEELKKVLPTGISVEVVSDDTKLIRSTIADLVSSTVLGAILAMAFVFLFLRSLRPTLVIGISIPMSIVVTLLCMYFAGFSLNMLTLTGLILGVGMIVDASIVIIDNIHAYRERGARPQTAAMIGTEEMIMPITASTLTTIVVFLPMIIFRQKLGRLAIMFESAMFTIVIALVASLFIALFLVPVLSSKYFPLVTREEKPIKSRFLKALDEGTGRALDALTRAYRVALKAALEHRATSIAIAVATFVLALVSMPRMNIIFTPPMADDSVNLSITLPVGTRYEETKDLVLQMDVAARSAIKGYKYIIATVGSSGRGWGSSKSYTGSLSITLDESGAKGMDTSRSVQAKLRSRFKDYPQASFSFSNRGGFGRKSDIEIYVRSDDLEAAMDTADGIVGLIKAKIPEIVDATTDMTNGLPQVEIVIDRQRAYSFGITVSSIANEIDANVDGDTATTFNQNGTDYDVVLALVASDKQSIPDLGKIFVLSSSGDRVPVSELASIRKSTGPVSIKRENQARIVTITGNLSGLRADKAEAKIRAAVAEGMVVPEDVTVEYSGSWSEISSTGLTFAGVLLLAILLVFGVMAGQYESFKDPFINLFTIPLMLIGVFGIHLATGIAFSMFTAVGLVMLVGIVVNNGIVLVDYTNLLRGRGMPLFEACLEAGASRLRPVLMTAVTTILGVMPMALFPSENASMMQPIGLCIMGGLTSSTFITLLLIPVIYYLFNAGSEAKALARADSGFGGDEPKEAAK